jgi:microcompartment protein CcmK/EutM
MRLARVIGSITLSQAHPAMRGGMLRLLVPLAAGDLAAGDGPAEPLVAWDSLGAGVGQLVAFSEGGEAAQPFRPDMRPVDAYVAAIIDRLDVPSLSAEPAPPE